MKFLGLPAAILASAPASSFTMGQRWDNCGAFASLGDRAFALAFDATSTAFSLEKIIYSLTARSAIRVWQKRCTRFLAARGAPQISREGVVR